MRAIFALVLKTLRYFLIGLIFFLGLSLVLGWASVPAKPGECLNKTTVYLQHSIVHADFVFPVDALSDDTKADIVLPVESAYIVFGIGDRDIYVNTPTWADLKARYALKALFVPSKRTMHVEPVFRVSEDWIPLELCADQVRELEAYILGSFKRDAGSRIMMIPDMTYTGYDRFYEADGTYMFYNTCNNWANTALKKAGQKTSVWAPFSQGVVYHAKKNARQNGH